MTKWVHHKWLVTNSLFYRKYIFCHKFRKPHLNICNRMFVTNYDRTLGHKIWWKGLSQIMPELFITKYNGKVRPKLWLNYLSLNITEKLCHKLWLNYMSQNMTESSITNNGIIGTNIWMFPATTYNTKYLFIKNYHLYRIIKNQTTKIYQIYQIYTILSNKQTSKVKIFITINKYHNILKLVKMIHYKFF